MVFNTSVTHDPARQLGLIPLYSWFIKRGLAKTKSTKIYRKLFYKLWNKHDMKRLGHDFSWRLFFFAFFLHYFHFLTRIFRVFLMGNQNTNILWQVTSIFIFLHGHLINRWRDIKLIMIALPVSLWFCFIQHEYYLF